LVVCSRAGLEWRDAATGVRARAVPCKWFEFLSPDGRTFVRRIGSFGLGIGETATGKVRAEWDLSVAANMRSHGLAFSPDGGLVAAVHQNKEIQVRDVAKGNVLVTLPLPEEALYREPGGAGVGYYDYRVGLSEDGQEVWLGTRYGTVRRWDRATREELPKLSKHLGKVAGVHFPRTGRTVVTVGHDGLIRRWDRATGRELAEPQAYRGPVWAGLSPDGKTAVVAEKGGRIDLYDAHTGKHLRRVQSQGPEVTNLAFSPNGKEFAASRTDGAVQFWEAPSGRPGRTLKWEGAEGWSFGWRAFCFSPDGARLCVGDYQRDRARLWDVASGEAVWEIGKAQPRAFSPDGKTVVATDRRPNVHLFDVLTGRVKATRSYLPSPGVEPGPVVWAAYAPGGRQLAISFESGGDFVLLDGETLAEKQRVAAVVPDDARILLLDVVNSQYGRVHTLAFSPDGKWLATGGGDGSVRVWETATGQAVRRLGGHEAEVSTVAFAPDGRALLSSAEDGQAYVWDLRPPGGVAPAAFGDALWADLGGQDGQKAYQAVWALADGGGPAAAFLREKLPPVKPVPPGRVAELVARLDSDRFAVREEATKALAALGPVIAPELRRALGKVTSAEASRRLKAVLAGFEGEPSPARLRTMRSVRAMELAATPAARGLLREWAGGATGATLTEEARAALARLARADRPPEKGD
ncbi:MAG TPA: WD40 repeat domain-containing protein, partial [Gemmataceae bacterium]